MSTADLLAECNSAGVILEVCGGSLEVDAPAGILTPELLARLREHKGELLNELELRQERAAIMEFDGGLSRDDAERLAGLQPTTPRGE